MKTFFHLFVAALALHASVAAADDAQCRSAFGQAMRSCASSWELLTSNSRSGAQKACVDGAVLTKAYCLSGVSACLDRCQVSYERSVAACETTFSRTMCAADAKCEAVIAQENDNCISSAVGVLDVCSAACP
jgi:hypothetical protein